MIDVKNDTCQFENCHVRATYNYKGQKKGIRCKTHILDNMVDVKHQCCIEDNCIVRASYGIKDKNPEYCSIHKKKDMINLIKKECEESNCTNTPNFNYEGETIGKYCASHKKDNMIDVRHDKCSYTGCNLQPGYIDNSTKKKYCSNHKTPSSNSLTKHCIAKGCTTIPTFGKIGTNTALRCAKHKEEDDTDIKHKFCKTELCGVRAIEKYDNYCLRCWVNINPNAPNARNYKTKESAVDSFITDTFPNITFATDKPIQDGCSKRRPDKIADIGSHLIIIETDENQHDKYDCSCENKRIMELSKDVGHRPIVFIRFNPDKYINKDGKEISSCWITDGRGMMVINKDKQQEWKYRLSQLKEMIEYWIRNVPEKTVEIIQLFYNQN